MSRHRSSSAGLRSTAALTVLLASSTAAGATPPAPTWSADLVHSRAEFRVTHLMLSKVWGHIPFQSMTLAAGPNGMPLQGVDVVLNIAHEDTDNQIRDADLRSKNYLDTADFPTIAFKSSKVVPGKKAEEFQIDGDLTIHGATKPVVLEAHYEGRVPEGGKSVRVAYTATTTIDRRDFGLDSAFLSPAGIPIVGNDVEIALTVEATSTGT